MRLTSASPHSRDTHTTSQPHFRLLVVIIILLCLIVGGTLLFARLRANSELSASLGQPNQLPALVQPTAIPDPTFPPPIKNKYP
jgi:hypothetical protein